MRKKMMAGRIIVLFIALSAMACATKTLYVPVMQPAEVNLKGYKSVAILGITGGRMGDRVTTQVKEALLSSKHLEVVERAKIQDVLFEQGFNAAQGGQLSQLVAADLLLTGKVLQEDYDEDTESRKATCTKYDESTKKSKEYSCTIYTRNGRYRFEATLDLVDVNTGSVIFSKRDFCKREKSTQETDGTPPSIDENALADQCVSQVSSVFIKAILPHTENMRADFKRDKKLPQLDSGITYAQVGQWEEAIAQFEAAVNEASSNPEIGGKAAARAHWDYGLALMFNYRFDEARNQFNLAFTASGGDTYYMSETQRCDKFESDYRKLQDQGVIPTE